MDRIFFTRSSIAAEEIRHDCYPETSIELAHPDETEPMQARLHTSLTLWSYCADWAETYGTFEQCKNVYDKMIDFKVTTPQIIINYGLFLQENKYFEEEFRAYEKGIDLFRWPNVYDIWHTYLTKFLQRYGGSKLERSRDLF
uniref:Pre-mRNA-splicing factor Syf1/CRNKL1-like C-terminal HAT-repeats domain-containing protein n=1 Tax=Trichogramma kaykai TaxID=54128 RepID=A0ABD2VYF0_9HYME